VNKNANIIRLIRPVARLIRTGFGLRGPGVVDAEGATGYALPCSESTLRDAHSKVMVRSSPHDVTRLLLDWRNGDKAALEKLMPLVYDELRRLANRYLRAERHGHTLQGTALVHEAYMKMVGYTDIEWQSRAHFFGVAARVMRQILIDYARKHQAGRRGGGTQVLSLGEAAVFSPERSADLVALDDALKDLAAFDQLKGRIIELRYFGGLSIEEIGEVESVSVATVRRHMRMAEAWLHRELSKH
jgi:RNA polymerase sigma factor (TIGR02999 family)